MTRRYGIGGIVSIVVIGIVTALAAATREGVDETSRRPAKVVRQAVSGGKWLSHRGPTDRRDWQVQFKHRDDGSLEGRVIVVGGALARARLVGRIDGSDVYGVLLDDGDNQVGNFSGTVAGEVASGTYRTIGGDEGEWSMGNG